MKESAASHLATAAVASGVLMAAYLLLRPYGEVASISSWPRADQSRRRRSVAPLRRLAS